MTAAPRLPGRAWPALHVPGPRPMPLLGPLGNVVRYISDPIGFTNRLFDAYGPVAALARGGGTNLLSPYGAPGTVFVYGPELIRQVRTPHERWEITPLTGPLYPLGEVPPRKAALKHFLVWPWITQGDEHRAQRKLVMPSMHRQRIAAYRDTMVASTSVMLDRWLVGAELDVVAELRTLAARIASAALFGEASADASDSAGQTVQDAVAALAEPLTTLLPYDLPGLPYRRFLDRIARFDTQMRAIIQRKRAAERDDGDVLSLLIAARHEESGVGLSEDELVGWVGSLFAAGHETSGLAIAWTLLLLAQHPSVAADLLDELASVLNGAPPTVEQLGRLPLLDAVVKESMRVIPPAPFTWRIATEPIELGGYHIPQGTEVYASIYRTHHMPELYAEPERFDPRRWATLDPGPYAYLPFSAGPRMCIGAAFGTLEVKIVLAMILQRFRLQFVPRVPVDRVGVITISPRRGLPMRVYPQDRQFATGVGGVRGNVREMVTLPA